MDLPVIECTLPPNGLDSRLADWVDVLAGAHTRTAVPGGVQVTLPDTLGLAATIRALAALEQQCCSFLDIALTGGAPGTLVLTLTGPDAALPLVEDLLGKPG